MSNFNAFSESLEDEEDCVVDLKDQLKAEMEAVLQEIAVEHADSDEYAKSARAMKDIADVYEKVAKVDRDDAKINAEIHEMMNKVEIERNRDSREQQSCEDKRKIDINAIAPKIAGIAAYSAVMMLFILVEKEHPPAMRLVQAVNTLIAPRNL